eukprot:1572212-Rhodomonas_salina.3
MADIAEHHTSPYKTSRSSILKRTSKDATSKHKILMSTCRKSWRIPHVSTKHRAYPTSVPSIAHTHT